MQIDCQLVLSIVLGWISITLVNVPLSVKAQIRPDNSVGTQVTPNVMINGILSNRIDGGTIQGANLFHSFSDFNIGAGTGVYFTNPNGVTNIFSRVTGTNPSNINGTLGVLGNANLFLLNPNGLIFGTSAKLDLKGSFIGTTATSMNFADGTEFSAANPQTRALLTVSVPVGLGFGSNPGGINVQGTGNYLLPPTSVYSPITHDPSVTGLQVASGQTLGLVGGDVSLSNGILIAPNGRIELGGVGANSLVKLTSTNPGFILDYTGVSQFKDIYLTQKSIADVSGFDAGSLQLQGQQITIDNGSLLLSQNYGAEPAGSINIYASDSLQLLGANSSNQSRSGLATEAFGSGNSGEINIVTPQLLLQDGGRIESHTYSNATASNINVQAEAINLNGFVAYDPYFVSQISSLTFSSGRTGNININSSYLSLQNGGTITASTGSIGQGGDITINADTIQLSGTSPIGNTTNISSEALSFGKGGNVIINSQTLSVMGGSAVTTSGDSNGDAGNLILNVRDLIQVSGANSFVPSKILSSIDIPPEAIRLILDLPNIPSGNAGNLTINTANLQVFDGGQVSVVNAGIGNAGTLKINANNIQLDSGNILAGTTISGEGGDITITANNLILRHDSYLATNADNQGNGGNINLNVGAIAQLEASTISANAGQGNGGNIIISTEGLFRSADSSITATSGLGINGTINVVTPVVNQENVLVKQPSNFVSVEKVVASSCIADRNVAQGQFVVTGNGGLAETPDNNLAIPLSLMQVSSVKNSQTNPSPTEQNNQGLTVRLWRLGDSIQEANQFITTADGKQFLITQMENLSVNPQKLICP